MAGNKEPEIKKRRAAWIGNPDGPLKKRVLAIQVEPGTQIFHPDTGDLLGTVGDRMPVYNLQAGTVYLSTDDWFAARKALPAAPKKTFH